MVFLALPNLINHSEGFPKMVVPENVHLRNLCRNIVCMLVDHYRVLLLDVGETLLQDLEKHVPLSMVCQRIWE